MNVVWMLAQISTPNQTRSMPEKFEIPMPQLPSSIGLPPPKMQ